MLSLNEIRDLPRPLTGAAAGAFATGLMSAGMLAAGHAGLIHKQPPESITEIALQKVHAHPKEKTEHALASALHFGFGITMGALYAAVEPILPRSVPAWLKGTLFGLAIWGISYKGWVPALRIMPTPEHDSPRRVAGMIGAHVVYGASLAEMLSRTSH